MAQALSRPLPRLRVARRPAAVVGALFVLLALVFAPATATAEAPLRLPDHITDTAGVLDAGQRADVQNALDTLYDEHKVSLWVVYTADFDGLSREAWTEQTAKLSGLGNKDALLAVATTGRDYWLDVPAALSEVTDSEIQSITEGSVQPALREQDWAGAAIAAAGGLGDAMTATNTSLKVLGVGIGVVVVAGAGVYLYSRKKRGDRLESSIAQARQVDPTDAAALSALPIPALDALAKDELVEMDNAIRTSEEELNLAVGEFGADATAPFTAAYDRAKATLASAFAIRQRLDDDIPETPEQQRQMLVELITTCERADRELNARVTEFDAMRDLLLDAPARLDALTQAVVALTVRIPEAEATLAALGGQFPASVLATVHDNPAMARERITFAEQNIEAGRKAATLPAGKQGPAVVAIRAAEGALDQARQLLDAVDRADTDIRHAIATLPAAMADVQEGIDAAGPLAEKGGPELAEAKAAAEAALQNAQSAKDTDPLGSFTKVVEADARLDAVLAQAQEANRQAERARARLDQDLTAAKSQVSAAADFISTRRGAVGAEARTRLSEAQRHLEAAQQLAESDPSKALQHAQSATQLASRALWAAQADVNRYQDNQRPPSGGVTGSGGNAAGAILGGILIDSMLRGGFGGRGGNWGGRGGGGWGGPGPGSFGGPSSSDRIGRGGGGRF
ncbi:TPM domain-containing protein [Rhodococcus hoagii]|uniref:TPM domain-containing protein n=1 Tax=Rhodococcus hoagii TaxID=43767 RepID=UPI000A11FF92|nr:TPM domain-containing protein [Prescottella equi]MBM4537060.1 TPM domain-containing protein [Prescottella equi]NKR49113.1 TPM domain-containing protein [Prescottella equi]NKR62265.1 TPM domain-containing protein [Prescottella equi]NKR77065.1 TPM domain-containing protein [Prescottella equi]NKR79974.1 TPM domain-containing protein [Prescottella equi]